MNVYKEPIIDRTIRLYQGGINLLNNPNPLADTDITVRKIPSAMPTPAT